MRSFRSHQISSDEGSDEEAHVHVDGMAAMLRDLGQTRQRRCDGEGKNQDGFQQLGAVGDGRVKIHLKEIVNSRRLASLK